MSPDELRKLFIQWKTEGRRLRISLLQDGQTSLWCIPTAWEVTEAPEAKFWFGFTELAWGEVTIPLASSSGLPRFELIDAKSRPLEDFSPDFECCIEFRWGYLPADRERCLICVMRKF